MFVALYLNRIFFKSQDHTVKHVQSHKLQEVNHTVDTPTKSAFFFFAKMDVSSQNTSYQLK